MKKILIKFLLSIAGGIISLIIFEIFLNITGIYDKKEIVFETNYRYKLDKRLIYSLKPDNVSEWETDEFHEEVFINSTGFRNRYNLKLGNYNETYRIFAIGDSWTFGHGLSDGFTYPELLENILNQSGCLNKEITVINAAVPGYSSDQSYRVIDEIITPYLPDAVIWNFTIGDVDDMLGPNPSLYDLDKENRLISHSGQYNWLYAQSIIHKFTPRILRKSNLYNMLVANLYSVNPDNLGKSRTESEILDYSVNKLKAQIKNWQSDKGKNTILIITRLPALADFSADQNQRYSYFFNNFVRMLKEQEIIYIDLTGQLKDDDTDPRRLFFKNDFHPNENGAKLIASILAKHLCEILPPMVNLPE
ncbi:MAG: hypothetical protein UV73_C0002G0151 [Candidatus Gottesmanbacteria bacterium GW2011_GWA2_43_14]|uniref:SGNH hydrolase-type esterase domain-containing protein n=1 Tax=Candidatus Gottesmanbacteria bacterium GW2011_GWA2_43_14 TaxID=1618443 RepID=A0A0G1DLH1_9BACT|nr:MAG: hypothetical protein UV73_C0002G0151 [Candidatus Gottesmanbacteria bacterium GW2011_GWA2_43_14]